MKKYEIINDDKKCVYQHILHRIKALIDIPKINVRAGDLGGYITNEHNLSHYGLCWVKDNAMIIGDYASVSEDAYLADNACISDHSKICDNSCVCGNAKVSGYAQIGGYSRITDNAFVSGRVRILEASYIAGDSRINNSAKIINSYIGDNAIIGGAAVISNSSIMHFTNIGGNAKICGTCIAISSNISNNALINSRRELLVVSGLGSMGRETIAYISDGDIIIKCGCFEGNINKFRHAVESTHQGNETKYGRDYLILASLIEEHFKEFLK